MVYLHVSIPSVRMMDTFTRMIRKNFPVEEHRFLYWDQLIGKDRELLKYGNSVEITGKRFARWKLILDELNHADVIIWHGLLFGAKRALIPLLFKKYMRKSVWIMRGLDLYNWKTDECGFKAWLTNKVNYYCRKNMPNVAAIFPTDEKVYREQFGNRAKLFCLPYPIAESTFELMEHYRNSRPRPNGKIYVQIGNNAYTFNKHLEILDRIQHFNDENIRVIIPLSYGNDWYNRTQEYFHMVSTKAAAFFGEKAVCLKHLMPPNEYSDLLCNIDISIYGSERQNALGNILRSLYLGNKVFLSEKNPLYRYFKNMGIDVYKTESISDMTFKEFCRPSNSSNAVKWIRSLYYPDASAIYWRNMFQQFKNNGADMIESATEEQIATALQGKFVDSESEYPVKKNYINLTRFISHPKRTKHSEIKDVVILGAGNSGIYVFQQLKNANKKATKWSINGFADYHIKTIGDYLNACDVIGTPEEIPITKSTVYFNMIADLTERRRAAEYICASGASLGRFEDSGCQLAVSAVLKSGCSFIGRCSVCNGAVIGCCTIIKSAFVDCFAQIGDYCTLERNCWIGEGVVIEDEVIVGAHARIAPGVRIGRGQVIPAFSTILGDIR